MGEPIPCSLSKVELNTFQITEVGTGPLTEQFCISWATAIGHITQEV